MSVRIASNVVKTSFFSNEPIIEISYLDAKDFALSDNLPIIIVLVGLQSSTWIIFELILDSSSVLSDCKTKTKRVSVLGLVAIRSMLW